MEEVYELCDRVTVFRDGRRIDTFDSVTDLDRDRLIGCMVGRSIEDVYGYRPRAAGDVLIEAKGLVGPGLSEPVSFTARRGEIVGFFDLGGGSFLGISYPIWSNIVGFLLRKTVFGKNVLAVGGNGEAALLASRMSLGDPKTSVGLELGVISACVLGGVSLTGGVATISGMLVGVLIMGSVQDAMSLLNVPTFYQYLIRGGILLLAVLFDQYRRNQRRAMKI
ncbi:arabinose ABC transporter permease [Burkholderia aenigmatica]|uniref:Arabinose ABC transporter permease n=1 Tax=Burkholderia aenigmatica TaxID=2015348 RepID=A0ABY6XT10_9BURK|nr:arabinose ABC transporter permease [Burkholderia aenigmatica]VWD32489.1 arabinose ABC transporter permease [Burkholderia aenigmatica]